jgi:hypothetical protein
MLLTNLSWKTSILSGLISGLVLAVLLKITESFTHLKVYTLLLNVDYIPYFNTFAFPELIEVGFQLIVSIALAVCLYLLFIQIQITSRKQIIVICNTVCFIIGVALFLQRLCQTEHLTSQVFTLFYTGLQGILFQFD